MDYTVSYNHNVLTESSRFKISTDSRNLERGLTVLIVSKRVYLDEVFSSALKGRPDQIGRLASVYFRGYGIEPDRDFAITILEEFIANTKTQSLPHIYALGTYYEETGRFEKSMEIYESLVEKNHGMAMTRFGKMYLNGHGVSKDIVHGVSLLKDGAKTGNVTSRGIYAKYLLGQRSFFKKLRGLFLMIRNIGPIIQSVKAQEYDGLV